MFQMKTCIICGQEWQPKTRYQATRNLTCSKACSNKKSSNTKKAKPLPMAACQQCGNLFRPKSHIPLNKAKFCSAACNARHRIQSEEYKAHLKKIAATGRAGWTEETKEAYRLKNLGPLNKSWKGGVTKKRLHGNYQGVMYTRCPAEYLPMARADGYIMTHRLVMAQKLGRCLTREEVVHHIDHNPANNKPDNLELYPSNGAHKRAEGAAKRLRQNGSKEQAAR